MRIKIKVLELTASYLGDFRIPRGAKWQERDIKRYYRAANKFRQKLGLQKKDYCFLNSKGEKEHVD